MNIKFNTLSHLWIGIIILSIPYFIWILLGEESYLTIDDNLDSELVYIKKLISSKTAFTLDPATKVTGIMNGLPRFVFRSGMNLTFLLFLIFTPVYAYIANHLIVHLIGYLGMFLLLKRHFVLKNNFLILIVSLSFGFVSYYHIQYGISISGQPLLLFTFLNFLNNKSKWYDWAIIFLFPFYSFLFVTLPFFVPLLLVIGICNHLFYNKTPKYYWIAITVICLVNAIVEFPMIESLIFNSDFTSHRLDWNIINLIGQHSLSQFYNDLKWSLKFTHYHAGEISTYVIKITLLIGLVMFKFRPKNMLLIIASFLLFVLLWEAFYETLMFYLIDKLPIFRIFNAERFYFLAPFLWILLFAVVINELNQRNIVIKLLSIFLLLYNLKDIISINKEFKENYTLLATGEIKNPTFKQFFDVQLFADVKKYIGSENIAKYNFASIGLYPSIAQYNGLNTIDSYQNNYEVQYKFQFREIIERELMKNEDIKNYYDDWGSRCYIMSSELGTNFMVGKNSTQVINHLELNMEQFKRINGKYIISAVPILNWHDIELNYLNEFSQRDSYWKLYLYEIDS